MSGLAAIERAVREARDFSRFDETYLHRAWRENALGRVRGRDRIRAGALAQAAEEPAGTLEVPTQIDGGARAMIAFACAGWRGHRWAQFEGQAIVGDIEVLDGMARASALGADVESEAPRLGREAPMHAPLGELRSGRGQLAEPDEPILPPQFPAAARPAAKYLHRVWNRRDLSAIPAQWQGPAEASEGGPSFVLGVLAALPDAVLTIEAGLTGERQVAVLWRLHGHHLGQGWGLPSGKRIRAIGSSVFSLDGNTVAAEDMVIDTLAMRAGAFRPVIDYA